MTRSLRIAAVQLPGCGSDPVVNRETAAAYLREAAGRGAELAVLPELATVPYFCSQEPAPYRYLAEPVDGELVAIFTRLCRECDIALVLPFYEREEATGRFYNSLVVIDRRGTILPARGRRGEYPVARKLHLAVSEEPHLSFDEPRHFTPGDGLGIFTLDGVRLGCLICYDRRFPECWRELRALGAHVVAVPVAGNGGDSVDFFLGELRTHARENGIVAVAANKIGPEYVGATVVENYGESCVVSAAGDIVARRPGAKGPGLVIAEIDIDEIMRTRQRLHYFDHRRLDLFPGPAAIDV